MDVSHSTADTTMFFLLVMVISVGTALADSPVKTVTIEIARERLIEGESQQIKCRTSGVIDEDVIQIYKMTINAKSPVSNFEGSFTINYVISANDTLNEEVSAQTEGRYALGMHRTGDRDVTVQLDISDVKSRDSASYMCGIGSMYSPWTDSHVETSDEKYFMVEGPIRHVTINSPRRGTTQCAYPAQDIKGQEILAHAGSEVTLDCEVGLGMNPRMPWVEVFMDSKPIPCLTVDKTSYNVPMHQVPLYDECVTLFYIWKFTPTKKDDGAKVVCQANLPQIYPKYINTTRILKVLDPQPTPKPVSQKNSQTDGNTGVRGVSLMSICSILTMVILSAALKT